MQTELNYTEKKQLNEDHPVLPVEETHPEVSPEGPKANDTLVFLDERRKKRLMSPSIRRQNTSAAITMTPKIWINISSSARTAANRPCHPIVARLPTVP